MEEIFSPPDLEEHFPARGIEEEGILLALGVPAGLPPLTGAVDGLEEVCLVILDTGLEVAALGLITEAVGILLEVFFVPPPLTGREVVGGLVGVVLEREDGLDEARVDLGFTVTGRKPLVDLLSRSETGAKRKRSITHNRGENKISQVTAKELTF